MWPPPREFIRQHDTATSLAEPEPTAEFVVFR
jgi:hypothetical protein